MKLDPKTIYVLHEWNFMIIWWHLIIHLYRLRRYWLKGEKAGTSEVFAILPGFPDNIRTNKDGDFWVALHCRRNLANYVLATWPKFRDFVLRLPIKAKYQFLIFIGGWPHGAILKYSPEGELLQILEDRPGKVVKAVSEVEEHDGRLWIGSVLMPFVAVYDLGSTTSWEPICLSDTALKTVE